MKIPYNDIEHGTIELEVPDELVRGFLGHVVNSSTWRYDNDLTPHLAFDAILKVRKQLIEGGKKILPVVAEVVADAIIGAGT